jgi:DNA gyrase subunit A
MYWLNVYEIPEGARTGKGKAIVNMIKVQPGELVRAMLTVTREDLERDDLYLVMQSRQGYIKKTPLSAFKNLRKAGIRALTINDEDDLIGAAVSDGDSEIILSTKLGMACRFHESEVRPMGRAARGVTSMRFKIEGDSIVSMEIVPALEEVEDENEAQEKGGPEILVISTGGMGKRSFVSTYRKTHRGAKGVVNMRLPEGESVVGAIQVAQGDEVILTTVKGQLTRMPVDEVRTVGRASKGVRIMRFKQEGDYITGAAKVAEVKFEDEDAGSDAESPNSPDDIHSGGNQNAVVNSAASNAADTATGSGDATEVDSSDALNASDSSDAAPQS